MKTPQFLLCPLLALSCGCAHVPKTAISFDPTRKVVNINSPKDIEITGLSFELATNGTVTLTIEKYTGKNNVEVIKAIADQNQKALEKITEAGGELLGKAIEAAK